MENHYTKLASKYKSKSFNPNKGKTHHIEVPFRMVIVGPSGSGKTNCLMNLLKVAFSGTFTHIYLCVKNVGNDPLYQQMVDKLGDDISVYEDGAVPPLADLPKDGDQLIIFDDLVGDSQATKEIIEYFKRARRDNISCVYLTQSYYKVDKFIRQNTNYIIIKKVASKRDLKLILGEYSFPVDLSVLEKMYHFATKRFEDILLLDVLHSNIYHNFIERLL